MNGALLIIKNYLPENEIPVHMYAKDPRHHFLFPNIWKFIMKKQFRTRMQFLCFQ